MREFTGKFLALLLRHKPEVLNLDMDENGYVSVEELIEKASKEYELNRDILDEIVITDNKQRFSYNGDKSKIRASQGHSVNVDVNLKEETPPDILFHGTSERFKESILEKGLLPMTRLYVHLSKDKDTAYNVGKRHGLPVIIYEVDCAQMVKDGYKFYLSDNKVWLTKEVPYKYLKEI